MIQIRNTYDNKILAQWSYSSEEIYPDYSSQKTSGIPQNLQMNVELLMKVLIYLEDILPKTH